MEEFVRWIDSQSQGKQKLYVKRLSANDTLATGAHQAGPYLPKMFLFEVLPKLNNPSANNPRVEFDLHVDSHGFRTKARAIWYNNRLRGGTRNEARITNLGGIQSPLLDPDSTGAIVIFSFAAGSRGQCRAWVCTEQREEEHFLARVGPVDPGKSIFWTPLGDYYVAIVDTQTSRKTTPRLKPTQIPKEWTKAFPSPGEIIEKSCELYPARNKSPDERLVRRRELEFEVFLSVEEAVELPHIRKGFPSIDSFVTKAQSIVQRRKARSGLSLELQTKRIFEEESLTQDVEFSYQPESDPGKRPDFLFPNEAAYKDSRYPKNRLRMLAVKTTCRDRWRQILNEAERIPVKHLLTLQEGVSENQFREMRRSKVQLVVPQSLMTKYPKPIREELVSFEAFIGEISRLPSRRL